MLDEYSIDHQAGKIFDSRTREYFAEVYSSYTIGNYRSAVVMLWSVAICDLIFKLENLAQTYQDQTAQNILLEISAKKLKNPTSSAWEMDLVKAVVERTQLIGVVEMKALEHLQQQRHLAAHPLIDDHSELHRPNRDEVRALIRNTLDDVLIKPPILATKVTSELVADIAKHQKILIDDAALATYVEQKYFKRFNAAVEKRVFRDLWLFVFKKEGDDFEANRYINYRTLMLLIKRNPARFEALIREDPDHFSQISLTHVMLIYLTGCLSKNPQMYPLLNEHVKIALQKDAASDGLTRCLAWFLADSLASHITMLSAWLDEDGHPAIDKYVWTALNEFSEAPEWSAQVRRLANKYYAKSWSFDEADNRFNEAIRPSLPAYTLDDLVHLMKCVEKNDQTYNRRAAWSDHKQVVDRVLSLDATFNLAPYPEFQPLTS
ncbi:hypothetical protein [Caballeronia sp. GAWG1-5s-s]|uniref:hypothetical protein n=1 Tax=Caballeronia sp. GAWG1-5s-s TaxID=2921743 RepID=UPI002028521C|nr:hypothetical protein [Caballeronia sp. GAWG1-5s-s]